MNKEYLKMKKMTYVQLVKYLHKKYGIPQGSYWLTPSCRSKNREIMRGKEGLFCHHVKEYLNSCLCDPNRAKEVPAVWHQNENLVYCNHLEHALLHLKIVEWFDKEKPTQCPCWQDGLGYFVMSKFNDDLLNEHEFKMPFYKIVAKQMEPYHDEIEDVFNEAYKYSHDYRC